jgi:hypothetical protein
VALIVALGDVCERVALAEEPEFSKRSITAEHPAFKIREVDAAAPIISPDGKYSASFAGNNGLHKFIVVSNTTEVGKSFRIEVVPTGFPPTFSPNSEYLATWRIVENGFFGTLGMLRQLVVNRCETGEEVLAGTLWILPDAICFYDDRVIVAGDSFRRGRDYCCQIFRHGEASCVANLVFPMPNLGLAGEFIDIRKVEVVDSQLRVHTINSTTSLFRIGPKSYHTYAWDWKRVTELSEQGEGILAVDSKLKLLYEYDNQADPVAELRRLGATVHPYQGLSFHYESNSIRDRLQGRPERVPMEGVSVDVYNVLLSDRGLWELLLKTPRIRELRFNHYQLVDLSPLLRMKDLEGFHTDRTPRKQDLAAIAGIKSLKAIPYRINDDDLLGDVATFSSLDSLALETQDVTDAGIDKITQMDSLRTIYLSETGISAKGIKGLEGMPNLHTIYIDFGINVNDQAVKIVADSQKIRYLFLGNSNRAPSKITDACLESIAGLVNLEDLSLGYVPITDVGVKYLLKAKKLRRLDLSGTRITDAALVDLVDLTSLETLHIRSCEKLTDVGLLQLGKHGGLKQVFVSRGRGISESGINELKKTRPDLLVH